MCDSSNSKIDVDVDDIGSNIKTDDEYAQNDEMVFKKTDDFGLQLSIQFGKRHSIFTKFLSEIRQFTTYESHEFR